MNVGALIIVCREVIEAGLVVGIVLVATKGIVGRERLVVSGIASGIAGAMLVAAFTGTISDMFEGAGQELFNALVLLMAVVMLGWHNIWMARHGRAIASEMKNVSTSVATGHRAPIAIAVVVGVAVLREGSEIVLFLYSLSLSASGGWVNMIAGGTAGLAVGGAISALTYFGLLNIPVRYLFVVTGWMITLMAAGMASQAIAFLQASIIPLLTDSLWDSSSILSDSSVFGSVLHTLVGYTDNPTGLQLIAYGAVIVATTILMRVANRFQLNGVRNSWRFDS